MKTLLILLFIFSHFSFVSCSSYVKSIHRQIDNESRVRKKRRPAPRGYNRGDRRPIQNPVTLGGIPTANTHRNMYPGVKRQYHTQGTRRYKASDLVDNQSDGSLWTGTNSESFLFVKNNLKRKGDIIIVEVMKKLKEQIQSELKRSFPERKKRTKKKKAKDDENPELAAAEKKEEEPADKVYDKISASVIEQVNQDYILIRGRKEIMYKKYKRYFFLQFQKEI